VKEQQKTKAQLTNELKEVRQRVSVLETKETELNQLKELINASTDVIGLIDTSGRVVITNEAHAKRLGKPQKELIGCSLWDLFPPEIAESRKAQIDNVIRTGQPISFEDQNRDTWFDSFYSPLFDNNGMVTGIAIIARNITKRKQAEELFKSLALSSPVGIYIIQEGKFQYVNPTFQKNTGYSETELIGTEALRLVFPEDRDMVRENAIGMLKGLLFQPYEFRSINKLGDTRWILEAVASINFKGKRAAVGTYVDITMRKKAEEKVEELYESEKGLRLSLENEIKRRVEFARALVHELKTPIVPIIAAGELLAEEIHDEQLLTIVNSVQRGAKTMSNRIDTLLDVARGELGMLVLEDGDVDMLNLITECIKDMSPVASTREISLILDLPPSLPLVWADKDRLEQVITNIVSNALKFTPKGGTITLQAKGNDSGLLVEIQDTGIGIPEKNWRDVFESYYRVEGGMQHRSGLGLGLALCKTIVEAHGGEIWVESEEDKGSTFSFTIPVSR